MDNTLKSSLHVVGHGKSRRENGRRHAFKDSTEPYHKEKRLSDVKATILRKGKVLSTIIIIIIIIIIKISSTAISPQKVIKTKNKEEKCVLIDVAILRTEMSCKRKQKRN
jgi:hypothetical protein